MSSPAKRYIKKFYMWYEVDPYPIDGGKYKVMIHRPLPELFNVYVKRNYFRRFTLETMPDQLKEIMAMVHSHDWNKLDPNFYVPPLQWTDVHPEYLKQIGWKTSRDEYCVIMDKDLLDSLRGESVS